MLRLGLEVLGLNVRGQGLLGQALVLQLCLEIRQVGLGGPQLGLRVEVLLLDLRAAQVQQHRLRLHGLAGLDAPSLDPARVARRDHDNGLRHQRADAPHLSQHLAASHCVCAYDGGSHAGRRRLDSGKSPPGPDKGRHRCGAGGDAASPLPLGISDAGPVHGRAGSAVPFRANESDQAGAVAPGHPYTNITPSASRTYRRHAEPCTERP